MRLQLRTAYFLILALAAAGCHAKGGVIHRVESGDSLTQIAHAYDVDVMDLLEANPRINADKLKPGEKILVPGASKRRRINKSVWELEDVKVSTKEEKEEAPREEEKPAVARKPGPAKQEPRVTAVQKIPSRAVSRKGPLVFSWPAKGTVISSFGMRNRKMHNGIDIRSTPGGSVGATASGKVVYVGNGVPGYGNLLIVRHPTNLFSVYAYVGKILAAKDAEVERGTVIAKLNAKPSEAFFHFELRQGKRALDPMKVLPRP